ncbi:MAG: hypothetical protein WC602_06700 [archaeon]
MFNRVIMLLPALLLVAGIASADVFVLSPTEQQLKPGTSIVLGSMQPGETLVFSIASKSGYGESFNWTSAMVSAESLPTGWQFSGSESNPTHFVLKVSVPPAQSAGAYSFKVKMANSSRNVSEEEITMTVFVENGLIKSSLENAKQETLVNENAKFLLTIVNSSIAEHSVLIGSTLPRYWFEQLSATVGPKSTMQFSLEVNPRVYGDRRFRFFVQSNLSGNVFKSFDSELVVHPTLKGKYLAPLYGFPAFSPNLMPVYLINSFIASLWK